MKTLELKGNERTIAKENALDEDFLHVPSTIEVVYEKTKRSREHIRGTNHLIKALKGISEAVKNPKRVVWVAVDAEAFQALLNEIRLLTSHLLKPMAKYYSRTIEQTTSKTYIEIVQMRGTVAELTKLYAATLQLILSTESASQRSSESLLQSLVELKLLSVPLNDPTQEINAEASRLAPSDVKIISRQEILCDRTRVIKSGKVETLSWVEWKDYVSNTEHDEDSDEDPRIQAHTLRQAAGLTELLKLPKLDEFKTPRCLGFFNDCEITGLDCIGWAFQMPANASFSSSPESLSDASDSESIQDPYQQPERQEEGLVWHPQSFHNIAHNASAELSA